MGKAVFTIQVFGLIAMFPAYVIAELNHRKGTLPFNNTHSVVIEKPLNKNIPAVINSKKGCENDVFIISQNIPLLK